MTDGVSLGGFDEVRFRVQFHKVGDIGVVAGVLGDEPALTGKDANRTVGMGASADFKQVAGVVGGQRDGLAAIVEIVVQVFDFLIAGKEVHVARASGGGSHVVEVGVDQLVGDVGWNVDVVHEYHAEVHSPVKLATRFST